MNDPAAPAPTDTNSVTGLPALKSFERDLMGLLAEAGRAGEPLSLVYADLDHFKKANDTHGHDAGNQVLRETARRLGGIVKGKGRVYHLHGEELAIVLPNHGSQEAISVAERARRGLATQPIALTGSRAGASDVRVTASFGIACYPEHGQDHAVLARAADAALYDAKEQGRDLVRVYGEPQPEKRAEPREPERRLPIPGDLTDEEREEMRQAYILGEEARCPHDGAPFRMIDVTNVASAGQDFVGDCPICGRHEQFVGPRRSKGR